MLAKEIMTSKPEYLPPTATLQEAAGMMLKGDYGFIPIGENDRLIGTITDRDITVRAVAKGKDPSKTAVKEVMSKGIQYCFEDEDLDEIGKKMEENQIRRLVVLNRDKRMVGILTLGDLACKSSDIELTGEITEAVSEH